MQFDILDEKDNKFFKRRELTLLLKHDATATPSKAELVKSLAASQSVVDESQVVVDYIFTKKGVCESLAKVKILHEKPAVKKEAGEEKEGKPVEAQTG